MSEKIEGSNKKSVNNIHRDYTNTDLVLGEPQGLLDTVHILHPELEELFIKAKSQMWSGKGEFDFSPCLKEFAKQDDNADLMIDTISYQYQADSLVAKSLLPIMAPFITNSEMNCAFAFNTAMECLHPDHEIYIKGKGWASIKDVNQGDEVLQYDLENGTISYGTVSSRIEKYNSSDYLISFKDQRHYHQIVTPNHRMVAQNTRKDCNTSVQFIVAEKLPITSSYRVILTGKKTGSLVELTPLDKLKIAFQADGTAGYYVERNNSQRIRFAFNKERKHKQLLEILNECNFEFSVTTTKALKYVTYIYVPSNIFASFDKEFSWVDLDNMDYKYARDFIEETLKWDGTHRKHTGKCAIGAYQNTRKRAIDVVSTIASFAGYRNSISKYTDRRHSFGERPYYAVNVVDRTSIQTYSMERECIPYTGKVYCVTVPTGAFLTRLNGRISVTGNCEHSIAYSEMIKTSFTDPEAILKKIIESQETADRMSKVEDVLEELYQAGLKYSAGDMSKDEAFPIVYRGMTAIYLLERIQFIASFAITFGLGEAGLFLPIANCVKKICADEIGVHSLVDEYVLREMRKMKYWKDQPKEFHDNIIEIIDDVERIEIEWTDFIFKDRIIVGLTPELVKDWVRFNVQMLKQSMDLPFEVKVKENPLPWMNNWLSLNKFQNAPQEIEKSDYAVGAMRDDLDDGEDFDV